MASRVFFSDYLHFTSFYKWLILDTSASVKSKTLSRWRFLAILNCNGGSSQVSRMSVLTQVCNPVTGSAEWVLQREDYDYKQEIARSAYADMLHDTERNEKYFEGIRLSIAELRKRGQDVHVLDIGTGTGLLSMMAVRCGADSVMACETFQPMASCAERMLQINGFQDKVHLVAKRSTELEVGLGKDMERLANLLVAEVFDTELIGEGAIETFRHAMENLLTEDAMVVPSSAVVYAQVISSDIIQRWNKIFPINEPYVPLQIPLSLMKGCTGGAGVHDLQVSQLPADWFTLLSRPLPVFTFDWSGREKKLTSNETSRVEFIAKEDGKCDAIVMWWDIILDQRGSVSLSCAPYWAHPNTAGNSSAESSDIPWRDHWMQGVYYLPEVVDVCEDESTTLIASHDRYYLWFNIEKQKRLVTNEELPFCACGVHLACSRTRLGQLNDPRRQQLYMQILRQHIHPDSVCLFLGDSCLLAVIAAKLGAQMVYIIDNYETSRQMLREFIERNDVKGRCIILAASAVSKTSCSQQATVVFGEPFFNTSLLPWHSLHFWYLHNASSHLISPNATILPSKLTIWALPVQFKDLWKIRAPLHQCYEFKMDIFDEMVEAARDEADGNVEPQPLWEYPSVALGAPQCLLSLCVDGSIPEVVSTSRVAMSVTGTGILNGIALWADWHFSDDATHVLTTGPTEAPVVNEKVKWDVYSSQGVHLLKKRIPVKPSENCSVECVTTFNPAVGEVAFSFLLSCEV